MKTLNTINELIETAESERERRILDIIKSTFVEEIENVSKQIIASSWQTESTYDFDGYSNDDSKEVISTDTAVSIVESIIYNSELL